MRALVVYCHPRPESFNAAVLKIVLGKLAEIGAEVRVSDLYNRDFKPVLSGDELERYLDCPDNQDLVRRDVDDVLWCNTLIFVYPTWWYGLPAMLKGWLDRVLLPDVAFIMPKSDGENIAPGLTHITRLGVFTTCGASWWLTRIIGAPGRRTLMRGVKFLCHRKCKTAFGAHYLMDTSSDKSRQAHLVSVGKRMDKLLSGKPAPNLKPAGTDQ